MTKIKFYKKSHKYKLGRKELMPVTTFVGQFFKPFNAREIARKLAKFPHNKRNKRGVRYWLKTWKGAADYGTRIHNLIDSFIKNQKTVTESDEDSIKVAYALDFLKSIGVNIYSNLVESEKIIFSDRLGLAGTIDILAIGNGTATVIDWKTNKKITSRAYKDEKAKGPLKDLADCNYNKYMCQLNVYGYILETEYGVKIENLYIAHLTDTGVESYLVPYNKEKVEEMLEWQKQK